MPKGLDEATVRTYGDRMKYGRVAAEESLRRQRDTADQKVREDQDAQINDFREYTRGTEHAGKT